MLMAIKVKELNIYPLVEALMKLPEDKEQTFLKHPGTYYYHLSLMMENRIGRNILQEFIDREITSYGMDWLTNKLLTRDKHMLELLERVKSRAVALGIPEKRRL